MKSRARKQGSKGAENATGEASGSGPDRLDVIATAAYFKAEARGFTSGQELNDWLAAEAEFQRAEKS